VAQRIEIFQVTCPPNTPQSAMLEADMTFNPGTVTGVEIIITDGHAGLTGLGLALAHQVVIPASGDVWIVGNDEKIAWPLDGYLNNGAWSAFIYNLDLVNPHGWQIRFLIDELAAGAGTATITPLSPDDILAAAATVQQATIEPALDVSA
jgi:hypothetical protein